MTALDRALERGRELTAKFRELEVDEQVALLAPRLYEHVHGFEMGAIYFDQLPLEATSSEERSRCRRTYLDTARFVVGMFRSYPT